MNTAVCTLFENDYHHGVAALVNSLLRSGFRGAVYAGYRGPLPPWASAAIPESIGAWPDAHRLRVTAECEIVFLPLRTAAHFTNIKPDFMLSLLDCGALDLEQLFYIDPDICVVESWQFLIDWVSCGIALCEDVNSPIEQHHPRRDGWRRHFAAYGVVLDFPSVAYVNGGCVGVSRRGREFLQNWQRLSGYMAEIIGGLEASMLDRGREFKSLGFANCFDRTDQDVLNAAMGMTQGINYSVLPRSAMAFTPGSTVMPHAVGARKPWRRRYVREALRGCAPGTADKVFWSCMEGPLFSLNRGQIRRRRASLRLASAMGMWFSRR